MFTVLMALLQVIMIILAYTVFLTMSARVEWFPTIMYGAGVAVLVLCLSFLVVATKG